MKASGMDLNGTVVRAMASHGQSMVAKWLQDGIHQSHFVSTCRSSHQSGFRLCDGTEVLNCGSFGPNEPKSFHTLNIDITYCLTCVCSFVLVG